MYNMLNYIVTVFISMITGIFEHKSALADKECSTCSKYFRTIEIVSAKADKRCKNGNDNL